MDDSIRLKWGGWDILILFKNVVFLDKIGKICSTEWEVFGYLLDEGFLDKQKEIIYYNDKSENKKNC